MISLLLNLKSNKLKKYLINIIYLLVISLHFDSIEPFNNVTIQDLLIPILLIPSWVKFIPLVLICFICTLNLRRSSMKNLSLISLALRSFRYTLIQNYFEEYLYLSYALAIVPVNRSIQLHYWKEFDLNSDYH